MSNEILLLEYKPLAAFPESTTCTAVIPCPLNQEKNKPDNPKCKSSQLVIKKGKRNLTIKKGDECKRFEVVAGNAEKLQEWLGSAGNFNPAKIESKATITAGPCTDKGVCSHKDKTYDVTFSTDQKNSTELKFNAYSDWQLQPWKDTPKIYPITFNTCSETLHAEIAVYPDIEFGIGIELKFSEDLGEKFTTDSVTNVQDTGYKISRASRKKSKKLKTQSATYVEETSQVKSKIRNISIFGFYKFSGQEIEIRKVFKKYIEYIEKVEEIVTPIMGLVNEIRGHENAAQEANNESQLQKVEDGKSGTSKGRFSLKKPNITFKLSALWEELDDCPECAYGAKVTIVLKPLFGLEFRYDLTYAILRATGFGNTIAEIKSYLEGEGLKLFALVFSTGFSINFEGAFEFNSQAPMKATGTLDFTFPAKLEATLFKMTKRIKKFGVSAAITIDVGAKGESGFKVKLIGNSAGVNYSVDWNGLKVTLVAKHDICISFREANCAPPNMDLLKQKNKDKSIEEEKSEFSYTFPGKPILKGDIYHSV